MKLKLIIATIGLLGLIGCTKEDKGILPSDLANPTFESRTGAIFIKWELPTDQSVEYVKVKYHDPLIDKEVVRLSSCDTILLPETRQKYGDYVVTLVPCSTTDTEGSPLQITTQSGKATASYIPTQLTLKADDLSTNAQEASEGAISNLLDGNTGTFFHSSWSVSIPGPHWIQVNLPVTIEGYYKFYYAPRSNSSNKPVDFDLLGSMDGADWFLIKNFKKDADNLPVTSKDAYTSPILPTTKPFKYVRYSVNATNTGSVYWTMSELKFYSIKVIDPEAVEK
ncbi:MAG: discoidin domain-containing protein [Bacteroides sp.]